MSTTRANMAQQKLREEIAQKTADYLANGGQITVLPYAPDEFLCGPLQTTVRREAAARKSGQASANWKGKTSSHQIHLHKAA